MTRCAELLAAVALVCVIPACAPAPENSPSAPAAASPAEGSARPLPGAPVPADARPPARGPARPDPALETLFQTSMQNGARLLRERQFEAASLELSKAVGVHPKHAVALRMLGTAYAQSNDMVRARRALEASINSDPMVPGTHYELAQLAMAQGDFDLARHESDRVLLLDPDNPKAREIVSISLFHQGDVDGAIRALEPIVRADPARINARLTLALAYEKKQRHAEARDLLRELVRQVPNHGEAWAALGRVSAALGDTAGAATAEATVERLRQAAAAPPAPPGS